MDTWKGVKQWQTQRMTQSKAPKRLSSISVRCATAGIHLKKHKKWIWDVVTSPWHKKRKGSPYRLARKSSLSKLIKWSRKCLIRKIKPVFRRICADKVFVNERNIRCLTHIKINFLMRQRSYRTNQVLCVKTATKPTTKKTQRNRIWVVVAAPWKSWYRKVLAHKKSDLKKIENKERFSWSSTRKVEIYRRRRPPFFWDSQSSSVQPYGIPCVRLKARKMF